MKTTIIFPDALVEKEYNSTLVSILVAIIVAGITLVISYNIIDFDNNAIISALIICGILASVVVSGVLSLSLQRDILASNGAPLCCRAIEFKESESKQIVESIEDGEWYNLNYISKRGMGTAMRIELVYTKDRSFVAYQLFKYVPHVYEPYSDIVYVKSTGKAEI